MKRNHPRALEIERFMKRYWQRRPLLVRGAFPGFRDPLSPAQVLALAADDAAQSRLVRRVGKKWSLEHGPFRPSRFKQLPRRDWTVLVQDTNHFSARAAALLQSFDFIPHARIDDVMVSYAVPGGSVGPRLTGRRGADSLTGPVSRITGSASRGSGMNTDGDVRTS